MKRRMSSNSILKHLALAAADLTIVNIAYFIMTLLHSNFSLSRGIYIQLLIRMPYISLIYIGLFAAVGLYRAVWKFAGLYEVALYVSTGLVSTVLTFLADYILMQLEHAYFPQKSWFGVLNISVYIDATLMIIGLCLFIRLFFRNLNARFFAKGPVGERLAQKKLMIIGAGISGKSFINEMELSGYRFGVPVVLVDDDPNCIGLRVSGIPVCGGCEQIPELAQKYAVDEIIFCIPSAVPQRKREILEIAMQTGLKIKMAPNYNDAKEPIPANIYSRAKSIDILDVLSRDEIVLNPDVCRYVTDGVVLVTGGGGSIGSELCRQVAKYSPAKIVIFDIYENNAYSLKNSLDSEYFGSPQIEIRIGSVREERRLREVFEEFHPDCVFHAAAHKHVPLMEDSPYEAIKNNILGTYNTAYCANEYGVKNFVLLSTDKAVNPTNVMGATKRTCELVIQHFNGISKGTKFAAVRFGNVLGSNGSVIPLFQSQIAKGGPVTVTHPDITRYFMTIPEAAQLVVQAGGLAKGGEVFVLDMGEPVKIVTLAEKLIRLSGFEPYVDIDIQFTGLRPGEKLYEELILQTEADSIRKTENDKIFVTAPFEFDNEKLMAHIKSIDTLDPSRAREFLSELVAGYQYKKS